MKYFYEIYLGVYGKFYKLIILFFNIVFCKNWFIFFFLLKGLRFDYYFYVIGIFSGKYGNFVRNNGYLILDVLDIVIKIL